MTFKSFIASFISENLRGTIDYYLYPELRVSWGGPFNGQFGRRVLYEELMRLQRPSLIIETGTYRGTTTALFGSLGVEVLTVECGARNFGYSRTRLRYLKNVSVLFGDSRSVLRRELAGRSISRGSIFAYLDAHWNEDLPLAEEIKIIYSKDPNAIVMIDDFHVPDDPGYGFDKYGTGKALTAEYISSLLIIYGLSTFYPTLPSSEETGFKRGCVVLASSANWHEKLLSTGLLRLTKC